MKTIVTILLLLKLVFGILIILDIVGVISNPNDYVISQQFDPNHLSKDALFYILKEILLFIFLGGLSYLDIKYLKDRLSKKWQYIYFALTVVFISLLVVGYYFWAKSGFDK